MRDGGANEHGKPDWKGWEWSGMMHGVGCIRMWLKKSETRGEAKAKALSGAQKSVSPCRTTRPFPGPRAVRA